MDNLGEVVDVDNKDGVVSRKGKRADEHEHLVEHIDVGEKTRERHNSWRWLDLLGLSNLVL